MKKWLLIASGILLASVVLAGSVIWYLREHREAAATPSGGRPVTVLGEQSASGDATSKDQPELSPTPLASTAPTPGLRVISSNGQVTQGGSTLGADTSKQQQEEPSRLPVPSEFGVYEQYKTNNGPLYQDITVGTGAEVKTGMLAGVLYQGWLTNGTMFDQAVQRDKPFVFKLGAGQVITGWEAGIAGMKVGGKRRLIVPPAYGYGDQAKGSIPANSLLVFDVELLATQ